VVFSTFSTKLSEELVIQNNKQRIPWGYLFPFILACMVSFGGCQGNQTPTGVSQAETPEMAVRKLVAVMSNEGRPAVPLAETTSGTPKYITFRDFSNNLWQFFVEKTLYPSADSADVYTFYSYDPAKVASSTVSSFTVKIKFQMVRVNNEWVLNDFIYTLTSEAPPIVVVTGMGVQGYITDSSTGKPISNAAVALYQGETLIESTLTAANGYYSLTVSVPGVYTLVATKDGFEFLTIPGISIQ